MAESKEAPAIPANQLQAMIDRAVAQALAAKAEAPEKPKGPKQCDLPKPAPSAHEVKTLVGRLREWGAQLSPVERDTLLLALADKVGL